MQFQWVSTTFGLYRYKYTGCNLKTTELLESALIGVCGVIRLNMVLIGKLAFQAKQFLYTFMANNRSKACSFNPCPADPGYTLPSQTV